MKRGLRAFAGAAGLLVVWLIAETASAQKLGGVLQISHRDSPASMSTLEEVTQSARASRSPTHKPSISSVPAMSAIRSYKT